MTDKSDVFKCEACGNIIAVIQSGDGELNCCTEKMVNVTPDEAKRLTYDLARPGAP